MADATGAGSASGSAAPQSCRFFAATRPKWAPKGLTLGACSIFRGPYSAGGASTHRHNSRKTLLSIKKSIIHYFHKIIIIKSNIDLVCFTRAIEPLNWTMSELRWWQSAHIATAIAATPHAPARLLMVRSCRCG